MKTMMPNLIFVYPFTQMHELDDQPQCTLVKKKEKKRKKSACDLHRSTGKLQLPLSPQ